MPNYAAMNPGKYHLGNAFNFPPIQNRKYIDRNRIIDIKWKTAVLTNRRIYAGNVKIEDKDGKIQVLNDSIFKSRSNRFDSFTLDRRIDVAVGDGEEIIKLIEYADRLLQFKQNTLHIINISGASEYLESTHKFKGVSSPAEVCKTDYGIVWCNVNGVYLYDGREVKDLFEKQGIRRISPSTWSSFYSAGVTMVGYVPLEKQVIVLKSNSTNGDIMVYDAITGSWSQGTSRANAQEKTNLVNIWDGRLVYGYENAAGKTTVAPWSVTPTIDIDGFDVQTKEMDFGTGSKKRVLKVYLTYKDGNSSGNTNVKPFFSKDGSGFSYAFVDSAGSTVENLPSSQGWTIVDLFTNNLASDIRSFGFQLLEVSGQDVQSGFEVNDITIIYRTKNVK